MAFDALESSDLVAGKPTKQEIFQTIKANEDDHETRMAALESEFATKPPIVFQVVGPYYLTAPITDAAGIIRIPLSVTLTNAILFVEDAGSSGTLQVDVQYYRSAAWNTIFTTQPSVAFGAGDYAISSNAVLLVTDIVAGDLLRMDVTTGQTGNLGFKLYLPYEVA